MASSRGRLSTLGRTVRLRSSSASTYSTKPASSSAWKPSSTPGADNTAATAVMVPAKPRSSNTNSGRRGEPNSQLMYSSRRSATLRCTEMWRGTSWPR